MAAAGRLELARLEKLVHGFERVRLLVVGDVMLDEYLWGDVERVSPEAPVPVVHVQRESRGARRRRQRGAQRGRDGRALPASARWSATTAPATASSSC